MVVRDLPQAKRLYCDVLQGKLMGEEETAGRKRSAFVAVSEDSVVELRNHFRVRAPRARDLEQNGEGLHCVTFKTRNLAKAARLPAIEKPCGPSRTVPNR